MPIIIVVNTGNGRTQCRNRMRGRQERADIADDLRQHGKRIRAVRAGNLQHQRQHANGLAHVAEARHHRVGEEREHEGGRPAGQHEQPRVHCLNVQEQQAAAQRERALQQCDHGEHAIMAEEQLMRLRIVELLTILARHRGLECYGHKQRSHEQRQNRVERSQLRAEILHREHSRALHLDGSCKSRRQRIGVVAEHVLDGVHIAAVQRVGKRAIERRQRGARLSEAFGGGIQHRANIGQLLACRLRGAVEISQRALQIGGRTAQCGGRAADRIGNIVELRLELAVEIGFDAVDGGLRLLGKLAHALAVGCGVAHFRVDIVGAGVE